jgi:hypothetical protein
MRAKWREGGRVRESEREHGRGGGGRSFVPLSDVFGTLYTLWRPFSSWPPLGECLNHRLEVWTEEQWA